MHAAESMGTGVGQQDTFGNYWPSLECEGQVGRKGKNSPPGRSQEMGTFPKYF